MMQCVYVWPVLCVVVTTILQRIPKTNQIKLTKHTHTPIHTRTSGDRCTELVLHVPPVALRRGLLLEIGWPCRWIRDQARIQRRRNGKFHQRARIRRRDRAHVEGHGMARKGHGQGPQFAGRVIELNWISNWIEYRTILYCLLSIGRHGKYYHASCMHCCSTEVPRKPINTVKKTTQK